MEKIIFLKKPNQGISLVSIGDLTCLGDLFGADGCEDFYLVSQGKVVGLNQAPESGRCYTVCPRLRGGKGGFGSMLRAIGAQIEKTTNREACRDLSGRRMRDVNNEKKMVEYLEKKAEQEREREKKKMEKLERLTRDPKHFFNDPAYEDKLHQAVENVDRAVEKGIVAHSIKRKMEQNGKHKEEPKLKKGLWLGEDDVSSGDSDLEDEENAELRIVKSKASSFSPDQAGTSGSSDSENFGSSSSKPSMGENIPDNSNIMDQSEPETGADVKSMTDKIQAIDDNGVSPSASPNNDTAANGTVASGSGTNASASPTNDTTENQTVDNPDTDAPARPTNDTKADGSVSDLGTNAPASPDKVTTTHGAIEELGTDAPTSVTATGDGATTIKNEPVDCDNIDLSTFGSASELESLGLEVLKALLMKKGVKCGGSLKERADRFFIVKDLPADKIDPSLLATKGKKRNRSKK